jgi:protein-L-isoaspartate(D-aspartate) O-methyltransferase
MLEQQIRPWQVKDQRILDLIGFMPREEFVPEACRTLAYIDMSLPLGHGQMMMPPKLEARLLQELQVGPKDKVLEVGTGSGYVTALLGGLAAKVHSIEIIPELAQDAMRKLDLHDIDNVTVEVGDASRGWAAHAPYDAIFVTGSIGLLPNSLREQLAPGGRLVVIVGDAPAMEARLVTRLDRDNWSVKSILETVVPRLINAPEPPRFVF